MRASAAARRAFSVAVPFCCCVHCCKSVGICASSCGLLPYHGRFGWPTVVVGFGGGGALLPPLARFGSGGGPPPLALLWWPLEEWPLLLPSFAIFLRCCVSESAFALLLLLEQRWWLLVGVPFVESDLLDALGDDWGAPQICNQVVSLGSLLQRPPLW